MEVSLDATRRQELTLVVQQGKFKTRYQQWGYSTMGLRSVLTAAMVLSAAGSLPVYAADMPAKAAPVIMVPDNPFFGVNDNRLTYAYLPEATDPGVPGKTAKQVYNFSHYDVWAYGTNLFTISLNKSDHNDPARGGTGGATEFYGVLRSTLGFNQIFHTDMFNVGPLQNVSFEIGGDVETENNQVGPSKRLGVVGLQFAFKLPYKGYFNVAPLLYKEINHNTFLGCGTITTGAPCIPDANTNFRENWALELNYYMDLGFLPEYLPLSISGRAGFYGPKGNQNSPLDNGFASKTEILAEPIRLTLDASRMVMGPKYSHFADVWVAYRYWQNKYGLDHERNTSCLGKNIDSCTENTVYTGVTVKF